MRKRENERENVNAQRLTSLRVAQTLEKLPTELSDLTKKKQSQFPKPTPPKVLPKPQRNIPQGSPLRKSEIQDVNSCQITTLRVAETFPTEVTNHTERLPSHTIPQHSPEIKREIKREVCRCSEITIQKLLSRVFIYISDHFC